MALLLLLIKVFFLFRRVMLFFCIPEGWYCVAFRHAFFLDYVYIKLCIRFCTQENIQTGITLRRQIDWREGRGYFAECGLRNAESCQGVICGKSSAERSATYPLLLFRIPQPKNSAFPRIAKLPFARIAQQMCNRCIPSRG